MSGCARRTLGFLLPPLACAVCAAAAAAQAAPLKVVRYHGYSVTVPRAWPVYDLARAPGTCVRFNRHAVYLGTPSAAQSCPATSIGRTEAILLSPLAARAPRGASALGAGSTTQRTTPVQASGLSGMGAVAAGQDHSLALKR